MPVPCRFHTKIQEKVLYGKLRNDIREIITISCKYKDVEIIDGAVCTDHIYLSVAIPPKISISGFMGYLKGKSTLMVYDRHPEQQSKWDKSFRARGYYVSTIGNITEDAIKKYIQEQSEESGKEERWVCQVKCVNFFDFLSAANLTADFITLMTIRRLV